MENIPKSVYFDNSASAIINPKSAEKAREYLEICANPSSTHSAGMAVRRAVEEARADIAAALKCTSKEVFFTSCGTESNNTALCALTYKNRHYGNVIVTTEAEHPSVLMTAKHLEESGFRTVFVSVKGGTVDYEELRQILKTEKVAVVSLMQANNQTGAVTDLSLVREAITESGSKALFHSDAVQGFLKVPQNAAGYISKYCDTASISAHKVGGFKGTGALFVKNGMTLKPLVFGGGQENGFRSGTENVIGIIAFGTAVKDFTREKSEHITLLKRYFTDKAKSELGDTVMFGSPENSVDALVNISLRRVKSEVCLNYLSSKGIFVSSSSACSSKTKRNPALEAFGFSEDYINSALRVGFSPFNTEEEVDVLIKELKNSLAFHM